MENRIAKKKSRGMIQRRKQRMIHGSGTKLAGPTSQSQLLRYENSEVRCSKIMVLSGEERETRMK